MREFYDKQVQQTESYKVLQHEEKMQDLRAVVRQAKTFKLEEEAKRKLKQD